MSLGISNYVDSEVAAIWPIFGLASIAWFFARFPGPALMKTFAHLLIVTSLGLGTAQLALLWGAKVVLTP